MCARAEEPPVIDAGADDACWKGAMVATDFSVLSSGGAQRAFRQTTVRAAWDDDALYLHAICLEPDPATITAEVTTRDGETWMEDAMEVFVQPDPGSAQYYHFIVNARGTLYDERTTDPSYDARARVAARIGDEAWRVEMAIPWRDLPGAPPRPGEAWGFNVGREHRPAEPTEWSTWSPLEEGLKKFGVPEGFGRLRFSGAPAADRDIRRVSALHLPEGLLENPGFLPGEDGIPSWRLSSHTEHSEIVPMSRHYALRNNGDYGIASQSLNVPVEPGDIFTVLSVVRAGEGAKAGIAVVQEMEDGSPDDLYPYFKLEMGDEFELQVGRIVVDSGARRLRSANLYRANRTGWVEYAWVQVFRGAVGLGGIHEARKCTGSDQRGLGDPWPTPAMKGFNPLPGGPLRALIFIGEFQRDAAELAERLEMDYDLVYCPTYRGSGKVDQCVAFDASAIERRLAAGDHDVIILAGRPSQPSVVQSIITAVERGVGLVAVEPLAGGGAAKPEVLDDLLGRLPDEPLEEDELPRVLGALSPEVISATSGGTEVLEALSAGAIGDGHAARLRWSEEVPGLVPFREGTNQYWEYRWAALARSILWAADRLPESRIEGLSFDDAGLNIHVSSPPAEALTAEVTWDHRFEVGRTVEHRIGLEDGRGTLTIPSTELPGNRRGPSIARVRLLTGDQPVDLAAAVVPGMETRITLEDLTAPELAEPGDSVEVAAQYSAETNGTLAAELVDAFGRVVSRDQTQVQAAEGATATFSLAVRDPLSVYHRIVVSALDGEVLADRAEQPLFVPAANADHLDRFRLAAGYAAMHIRCAPWLEDHLVAFLRAHGVEATTVNEYMIQRGMPAFGGVARAGMRYSGSEHVRQRCMSNPEHLQTVVERTLETVGQKHHWGFLGFNMDDETHLAQQANVELCGSEHCLARFREWAAEEYHSIEAANAEWDTDFASFDDVGMPLLADMQGAENPALWVDYRLHMDRVWAGAYAAAHDAVRERYPHVRMSFTNPYKYNSLSGTHFGLWVPNEEILLRYSHRHVLDRDMSWTDAPILSWFGYRTGALGCRHFVWRFALNGGVMPIWWNPVEPWAYSDRGPGFTPWYMFGPLWRETGRSKAVTGASRDLRNGIARLLRVADRARPQAAILHSQASKHLLYAQPALERGMPTDEGWDRYHASDGAMAAALIRRAVAYRYLLPEELEGPAMRGIDLLVLPCCLALSDESVAAIRKFAAAGGMVLADAMPATHTGHGRPRDGGSPLNEVMAGDRAFVLGRHADAEAADSLDAAIAELGLQPEVRWRTRRGGLPQHTRLFRMTLGAAQYLGLLRDPSADAAADGPVTLELPRAAWVYDSRGGRLLGRLESVEVDVAPGEARFLALLPYRPDGLSVAASGHGDELLIEAAVQAELTPTDHVVHLEVTPPGEDAPRYEYTRDVVAEHGTREIAIPLAHSDPAGIWHVSARDVATGLTASADADIAPHP
ncbi:MAG: sugar-binding protein [Armatimonadota bacterium]|nr:sugar-binding protein [Armatimonadota bacterium]